MPYRRLGLSRSSLPRQKQVLTCPAAAQHLPHAHEGRGAKGIGPKDYATNSNATWRSDSQIIVHEEHRRTFNFGSCIPAGTGTSQICHIYFSKKFRIAELQSSKAMIDWPERNSPGSSLEFAA